MKKFYSFLFAAVALVGFAACNSDSTEEPAPAQQVGKMEFTANIGEDTKTQLEGTKVKWCAGDAIAISNGTVVKKYEIKSEMISDNGKTATFAGDPMDGDTFYAVYPYAEDAAYTDGKWNVTIPTEQVAVAGSFADGAALAYGEYQGDYTFSFTNENAVLKFQVPENCSFVEFYNGEDLAVELNGGLTAGKDYYAVVAPGTYTFVARIDACPSKQGTKALDLEKNNIYNLGTLHAKQTTTVNLVPGVWAGDNAWFAAYYYNGDSDMMVKMAALEGKDGVYTADVAADAKIVFVRMNPEFDSLEWNKMDGDKIVEHHVWNQTEDLTLPVGDENYYYITGWEETDGEWHVKDYEFPVNTTPSVLYMKPFGNGWGTWIQNNERYAAYFYGGIAGDEWVSMTDDDKDGIYQCDVPTGRKNVIFCRMNGSNSNNDWSNKWDQTINLTIPTDGNNLFTVSSEKEGNNNKGSWSKK